MYSRKVDDYAHHNLCTIVDDNPEYSLVQLKTKMEVEVAGIIVSVSLNVCLLDGHDYRNVIVQPKERNPLDVKEKQVDFAWRPAKEGMSFSIDLVLFKQFLANWKGQMKINFRKSVYYFKPLVWILVFCRSSEQFSRFCDHRAWRLGRKRSINSDYGWRWNVCDLDAKLEDHKTLKTLIFNAA